MLNYRDIGKQIKIERIKHDLTQEQLSEKAGISVSHLSGIERGTTKLGLSAFFEIANALKVSTDNLLCYSLDTQESKIILSGNIAKLIEGCSKNEMIVIEELIRATVNSLRRVCDNCDKEQNY